MLLLTGIGSIVAVSAHLVMLQSCSCCCMVFSHLWVATFLELHRQEQLVPSLADVLHGDLGDFRWEEVRYDIGRFRCVSEIDIGIPPDGDIFVVPGLTWSAGYVFTFWEPVPFEIFILHHPKKKGRAAAAQRPRSAAVPSDRCC